MATRTLTVVLAGDAKGAVGALGEAEGGFSKFGKVAAIGAAAGVAAFAAIGAKGVANVAKLQSGLAEVRTLLPDLTDAGFGELRDSVLDFSNEMGVATDEALPALYQAISAGVPKDNAIDFMKTATAAAIGGVTDLETAVDGISSVMNSYGADTVNAAQASDLMFTAVKLGKTDFEQLSKSLFNVVPIASAMGVGFEEVTASMALMTAQGVPTSVATTQLRAAITELTKVSPEGATVLQATLGKTLQELQSEGHSLGDVLTMMRDKVGDVGFQSAFGSVEAYQAALVLTKDAGEAYAGVLDQMATSQGATDAAFATMSDTLNFKVEKVMNRVNNLFTEVGVQLLPIVTAALDAAIPVIDNLAGFISTKLIPSIGTFIEIGKNVAGTVIQLSGTIISSFLPVLQAVSVAWSTIWDEVLAVIADVKNAFTAEFDAMGLPAINWMEVIKSAVNTVVGVIQAATPIISAAIRVIGVVIIALIPVLQELLAAWKIVWGEIASAFGAVKAELSNELGGLGLEAVNWAAVMDTAVTVLVTAVKVALPIVVGTIRGMANVIITLIRVGREVISFFSNVFKGDWAAAWQDVQDIGTELMAGITRQAQIFFDVIKSVAAVFGVDIVAVFTSIKDALLGPFVGAIESVKGVWTSALNAMDAVLQKVWIGSSIQPVLQAWGDFMEGPLASAIEFLRNAWETATGAIDTAVNAVWDVIGPVFEKIGGAVSFLWGFIEPYFKNFIGILTGGEGGTAGVINSAEKMQGVFLAVLKLIGVTAAKWIGHIVKTIKLIVAVGTEVIDFVQNIFAKDWEAAWQNVQNIALAFVDYVTSKIQAVIDIVVALAAVFGVDLNPAIQQAKDVWENVLGSIGKAWDTFRDKVFPGLQAIGFVIADEFQPVVEELKRSWVEIWGTIKEEFQKVKDSLLPAFNEIKAVFEGLFGSMSDQFDNVEVKMPLFRDIMISVIDVVVLAIQVATPIIVAAVQLIGLTLKTLVDVAREVIEFFQNVFAGDWSAAWENIQNIVSIAIDFITGFITIWIDQVTGVARAFGIDLPAIFSGMWDAVTTTFRRARDAIAGVVDSILSKVQSVINAVSSVKNAASSVTNAATGVANRVKSFIPGFAEGGYVAPTPGGQIIRVAEAGEGEFIVPESRMGNMAATSGGNTYHITVNAPFTPTDEIAERVYDVIQLLERQGSLATRITA